MNFYLRNIFIILLASSADIRAGMNVSNEPICVIDGTQSALNRPEGVAYSPDGKCLAVANSDGYSITIYPQSDASAGIYQTTPMQVIQDINILRYPHDLKFTSCGQFLGVASRDNNSIVFFKCIETGVEPNPFSIQQGPFSNLNLPAGMSFRKGDEVMGIANRAGLISLTFYHKIKEGTYANTPFFQVTDDRLREYGLSAPHAIAFSPDGKTFAVVHKRVCGNSPGKSALAIWDAVQMRPVFIYTLGYECIHSVSYHPSGKYIAVTNEREDVMIFEEIEPLVFSLCASVNIDRRGYFEGAKGVAFSPCGHYLAITTMWPAVIIYRVDET